MLDFDSAFAVFLSGGTLPDGVVREAPAREFATTAGDLGYGRDLSCFEDFTPDFAMIDPNSTIAVVQSNWRRINTPPAVAAAVDEPVHALFDVRSLLQKATTPQRINQYQDEIRECIMYDDRNASCVCTLELDAAGETLTMTLTGTTARGPYSLVSALTDGAALIREMSAEGINYVKP
jgi:hypothetical protein